MICSRPEQRWSFLESLTARDFYLYHHFCQILPLPNLIKSSTNQHLMLLSLCEYHHSLFSLCVLLDKRLVRHHPILCEHHLLPFFGVAHVGYIPNGKVVGLSKIPRLVDMFANRLQIQEVLTQQIADTLNQALKPDGVGVVIEGKHICTMMRGVQKDQAKMITSAMLGSFRDDEKTRAEFLSLIRSKRVNEF